MSPAPTPLPSTPSILTLDDPAQSEGYARYAAELTSIFTRRVCAMCAVATALIAAFDLTFGRYQPHDARTLLGEQAALCAILLAYALMPLPWLRRVGVFKVSAVAAFAMTLVFGYAVGHLMGTASYLFIALDMTPFISVPLLIPLRRRLLVAGLLGLGPMLGFAASFEGRLPTMYAAHTAGLWLVGVSASVVGGHALYKVAYEAWSGRQTIEAQRAELAALCDELQGRVAGQTRELRRLASHLDVLIETERKRIAAELHDDFGQELTGMRLELAVLLVSIASAPSTSRINRVSSSLDRIHEKLQRVVSALRPKVLDDGGLVRGVEWLIRQQSDGTEITLDAALPEEPDPAVALVAFRIVQEALTNVARHAQANTARVALAVEGPTLVVTVEDDGLGLSRPSDPSIHHGIVGMHERALGVGGSFEIKTRAPQGTRVYARLPLRAPAMSAPPLRAA